MVPNVPRAKSCRCCGPATLLAPNVQSTYVSPADGYIPGCVASASRCRAGTSRDGDSSVSRSLQSLRSARLSRSGGFEPERRSVPGHVSAPGTVFDPAQQVSALPGPVLLAGTSLLAACRACSDLPGGLLAAPILDGPTLDAPDCVADPDPRSQRAAALRFRAIPFGAAPRVAIRPSPNPRIRWTVASPARAVCARRPTRPPPS